MSTPNPETNTSSASPSRSGAFEQAVDRRVEQFSESISFDYRLFQQDITGSIAHAKMLARQQIITDAERDAIVNELEKIRSEIESGEFPFRTELEDIHMNIEQALIDRLGDTGRKLHTGRSRNDQVATDFRLWIRDQIDLLDQRLTQIQKAFLVRCQQDRTIVVPAYTHLQRAQPVLAPHYWLAYIEKYERDRERLADCRKRVNRLSLGTAALAGTSMPIDREFVRQELGFEALVENSLDSSSDRDFAIEFASCLSIVAIHLSGWAEEWILWSSKEFGFLKLPHAFCTGSSIMPQKINPDVLELTRGKSARVVGNLQTLLVLTKGLPLAYNRDLQEDKLPIFDSAETVLACLEVAAPMIEQSVLNEEKIRSGLEMGFLDATTLMEYLIKKGLPQRSAHHLVGQIVKLATEKSVPLSQLSVEDFQSFDPTLDDSIYDVLGVDNAIKAFQSFGSTAPQRVETQIQNWTNRLTGTNS